MHDLEYLDFDPDLSSPEAVSAYDELPLWSAMFGMLLLEHVPLAGVRVALDVGCGTGFPLIELAERLGPPAHVHGVDPWNAALARANEKASRRSTPNITVHEATGARMPFTDGTFDLIVSNLGINNFDDAAAVVRECRRVARDGATLALTSNLQGHMREFYEMFEGVLTSAGDHDAIVRLRDHVAHRATVSGTRALLEKGGFKVTRVVERTAAMRFASGTALLNHFFIKLGFLAGWKKVVSGSESAVFAELQKRLDARAHEKGELALTIPMAYIEAKAS
ncbi:MAG TPA: class I SAM-dependent methyltransferase [Thermoanaerobaculia bacterium]|nr:class I SAM-dependent methyltransferase [Thermoanaerobaculia bacterium]